MGTTEILDPLKVFQDSLHDHGLVRRGDSMMQWMASQTRVEEFIDIVGRGGSMRDYAESNGLAYTALVLFVNTSYNGKLRKLIDSARSEYRRQCAANVLDRVLEAGASAEDVTALPEMSEGHKRLMGACLELARMEEPARVNPSQTTQVNVQNNVNVSLADLHGKIQERRRVQARIIEHDQRFEEEADPLGD